MISLATETERTLFFDFLPVDLGTIRGFKTRFHLYTVPGQVYYNASRKLILKGVDGVVFVADSQIERMEANIEAMQNLYDNMAAARLRPHPHSRSSSSTTSATCPTPRPSPSCRRRSTRAGRSRTRRASAPTADPYHDGRVPRRQQQDGQWIERLTVLRGGGRERRRRVRHPQGGQQARRSRRWADGRRRPMWTLPNIVTLVRICFTPVIALLPFIEGYWPKLIAFIVFVLVGVHRHARRLPRPQPQPGHRPRQAARSRSPTSCSSSPRLIPIYWISRDAARPLRHPGLGQHPALGLRC